MKLNRIILPILALALLATGCKKEYVSYTYGAQVETYRYNVTPAQWNVVQGQYEQGSDNYLYCTLKVPAITDEVFDHGTVQVFVWNIYDVNNNLGAWNTLPFLYPLEVWKTADDGSRYLEIEPENLRFEWEKGTVTLIIQELDGCDPALLESTLSFKVCITHNM